MNPDRQARPVLLVGSVPLNSAEEVFKAVTTQIGPLVARIPDGETGDRSSWIVCQGGPISRSQGLEVGGERNFQGGIKNPRYKIKNGLGPDDVRFARLGYADNALASYTIFRRLKTSGLIDSDTKFQVSLPTALAVVYAFFIDSDLRRIWPAYEKALLNELDGIVEKVPHAELAIQIDIASEIHTFMEEPRLKAAFPFEELLESFTRMASHVPVDVQLGIHLCYGDPGHKHIREPVDMGRMVQVYNRLAPKLQRPINWVHMPVPRNRDDDAYFEPLRDLRLNSGSELYLGLIHLTDGIDGARRRANAAKRVISNFGVATECGFGRRPPGTIPTLLSLHQTVAQDV